MKKSFILLLLLIPFIDLFSQEKDSPGKIRVDLGYTYLRNSLNSDNYYHFIYSDAPATDEASMSGVHLKVTIPGKIKQLDFICGTMFMMSNGKTGSTSWTPGNTNSFDYRLNGGGVYLGVSPKIKGKIFGITSDFAIGAFSFKEYLAIFNNVTDPQVDKYERAASNGIGGMSSLGFYVKSGNFGINPAVTAVYSGGADASFLFYGFTVPVTIEF